MLPQPSEVSHVTCYAHMYIFAAVPTPPPPGRFCLTVRMKTDMSTVPLNAPDASLLPVATATHPSPKVEPLLVQASIPASAGVGSEMPQAMQFQPVSSMIPASDVTPAPAILSCQLPPVRITSSLIYHCRLILSPYTSITSSRDHDG